MAPRFLSLADVRTDEAAVEIASVLQAGGVVVLPTDTVYGLVALPGSAAATDRLFSLKGRGADTPLAVLCHSSDQALSLADLSTWPELDVVVAEVSRRWWPGPLTLVLPRGAGLALHLGEPPATIGLRVPDHDLVRAVARLVGPIAATSANRHGEPTPSTAVEVSAAFDSGVGLVVDGGTLAASASTVIDAARAHWTALREGPIAAAEVLAVAHAHGFGDR